MSRTTTEHLTAPKGRVELTTFKWLDDPEPAHVVLYCYPTDTPGVTFDWAAAKLTETEARQLAVELIAAADRLASGMPTESSGWLDGESDNVRA